jgi:Lon protease-like protein
MTNRKLDLDRFEPDYDAKCENCGQTPCVTGMKAGQVVYESRMCGPCTFGTAAALDEAWWNDTDDN